MSVIPIQCEVPKKMRLVSKLVCNAYEDDISEYAIQVNESGDLRPRIMFVNKPNQSFSALFTLKDNWCDIKRKMAKLIESDGICVVCFEKEIYPKLKKSPYPNHDSNFCFNCCEMFCENCFNRFKDDCCVVCRKSQDELNGYYLRKDDDDEKK